MRLLAWTVAAAIAAGGPALAADPKNLMDNRTYAAEAAKEPGAKKFPSGLILFELQPGTGKQPTQASTVRVHYRGTLIDGTEFDSSYRRGQPAEFPVTRVIKCWTDALQQMKVGGKARLVCPAKAAYGLRGSPPSIPPNATLIFEIELLDSL